MCVMSMVMDHKAWEWDKRYFEPIVTPPTPAVPTPLPYYGPLPTQEEIDEFRRLLDRAREYDKRTGQEDCEMEEKKKRLLNMAQKLGVDISFV